MASSLRASKQKPSTSAALGNKEAGSPKLLTGGNPQIAKGDGDAPVQAYISAMPGWKQAVGRRLDELITSQFPNVQKAVRWNSPFYGIVGNGWLVSFHVLSRHVQLNFFCGSSLDPVPPGKGKDPNARWLNIAEVDRLDEEQITSWLRQSTQLDGWASFSS
jgi:hypothetical protein